MTIILDSDWSIISATARRQAEEAGRREEGSGLEAGGGAGDERKPVLCTVQHCICVQWAEQGIVDW